MFVVCLCEDLEKRNVYCFPSLLITNAFFKKLENFVAVQACIPHTDFIEKAIHFVAGCGVAAKVKRSFGECIFSATFAPDKSAVKVILQTGTCADEGDMVPGVQ